MDDLDERQRRVSVRGGEKGGRMIKKVLGVENRCCLFFFFLMILKKHFRDH